MSLCSWETERRRSAWSLSLIHIYAGLVLLMDIETMDPISLAPGASETISLDNTTEELPQSAVTVDDSSVASAVIASTYHDAQSGETTYTLSLIHI